MALATVLELRHNLPEMIRLEVISASRHEANIRDMPQLTRRRINNLPQMGLLEMQAHMEYHLLEEGGGLQSQPQLARGC